MWFFELPRRLIRSILFPYQCRFSVPPLPVTVIHDLHTTLSEEARNALNFFKMWYPDRSRPRLCANIARISLLGSSKNYISSSGKYQPRPQGLLLDDFQYRRSAILKIVEEKALRTRLGKYLPSGLAYGWCAGNLN